MISDQQILEWIVGVIDRDSWDKVLPKSGSVFRKVGREEAEQIAPIVLKSARAEGNPLWFLMGNIGWESRWDQRVMNPNGRVPPQVATTDYGIAQRSGANLIAEARRAKEPIEVMIKRALSAEWSIPWMARKLRRLLTWAKDYPNSDPFYIAPMAYNKGEVGAKAILLNDRSIINKYRAPDKQMGLLEFFAYKRSGHKHARFVQGMCSGYERELRDLHNWGR